MILFGASGHSKSIIDIADSIGEHITIIYDDNPRAEAICHIPVKKYHKGVSIINDTVIIAIGDNKNRKHISEILKANYTTLIHHMAYISKWSSVGDGTVVMANAVVNSCTAVGNHCIINTAAVIEHDCEIADYVHISPKACLAGGVSVGEGSHIGTGASVIPGIKIGKWTTIGAGAVIIKDVPDGTTVVGNPGRIIKQSPNSY